MLVTMPKKRCTAFPSFTQSSIILFAVGMRPRSLHLASRQVQRLLNRYRKSGAAGLVDAPRGITATHRIDEFCIIPY
ncbi:hypothetical protein SODG_006287 [Sodalis praecaptivus]